MSTLEHACQQTMDVGTRGCNANGQRFNFNQTSRMCERFNYYGCGGNKNNFETEMQCQQACGGGRGETVPSKIGHLD